MAHERINSRADLRRFLAEDLHAYNLRRWRCWVSLRLPQLKLQRLLRRTEYWQGTGSVGRPVYLWYRLRLARASQRLGISIPPGVFGPGLSIPHYGSIVVNDKARFGRYCRIHVGTNIGEVDGRAPLGGDCVYIAPGAVLYGRVDIGDNVAIGANSVVNVDVESNCTVAGAPARVVSTAKAGIDAMPAHLKESLAGYLAVKQAQRVEA